MGDGTLVEVDEFKLLALPSVRIFLDIDALSNNRTRFQNCLLSFHHKRHDLLTCALLNLYKATYIVLVFGAFIKGIIWIG